MPTIFQDKPKLRPVIFDIIMPDGNSILADNLKLVLHVNPTSMSPKYEKVIERIQTKSGFVEQHWGEGIQSIGFEFATGGFQRLYTGLVGTAVDRRDTLAYDSYLDILALFHNNGAVYDIAGQAVINGQIQITFDGAVYTGWFASFNVTDAVEKPYQLALTAEFTVAKELQTWRTSNA